MSGHNANVNFSLSFFANHFTLCVNPPPTHLLHISLLHTSYPKTNSRNKNSKQTNAKGYCVNVMFVEL